MGCASWLLSSNVVNTRFYESWGYVIVKEIRIGEDNHTWRKSPFRVLVVCHLISGWLSVRCSIMLLHRWHASQLGRLRASNEHPVTIIERAYS